MKKFTVSDDCIDCGMCYNSYPDLFKEENGKAEPIVKEEYTEEDEQNVIAAENACSAGDAISHE
jgi:ferredoxin